MLYHPTKEEREMENSTFAKALVDKRSDGVMEYWNY